MALQVNGSNELESTYVHPIHLILHRIKLTAPAGVDVSWEYPGYISIILPNDIEIAFGESLESDSTYSWNTTDKDGMSQFCGSFDDFGDIDLIVKELWKQTRPVLESAGLCSADDEIAECLICHTTKDLLDEADRADYRNAGYIGIDFYPHICKDCFELEKAR